MLHVSIPVVRILRSFRSGVIARIDLLTLIKIGFLFMK
ncbi:hypothetical protein AF41_02777 [Citrobacter sp. MGH 55]|nr:hypothetical protein AF41_02777 [Citrobacter sp. MGH 55]